MTISFFHLLPSYLPTFDFDSVGDSRAESLHGFTWMHVACQIWWPTCAFDDFLRLPLPEEKGKKTCEVSARSNNNNNNNNNNNKKKNSLELENIPCHISTKLWVNTSMQTWINIQPPHLASAFTQANPSPKTKIHLPTTILQMKF